MIAPGRGASGWERTLAERVFVALGANLGDPLAQLRGALGALGGTHGLHLVAVSRWHRTAPVGGPAGQPEYWNGAAELRSDLEPLELLRRMQAIEAEYGRTREVKHGPRTLDLDLLLFGARSAVGPELCLPHPRMEERLFVLVPLSDIDPQLVLPRCGRTVAEQIRWLECRGAQGVPSAAAIG